MEQVGQEREAVADVELEGWLAQVRATPPAPGVVLDLAVLRAGRQRPPGPLVAHVRDLVVPGAAGAPAVGVRLYRPGQGPLPLVMHVHGGGFTFGGLDSHDRACRRLAQRTGAVVLAVDYRLAPEHHAPAAVDDVVRVVRWTQTRPGELGPLLAGPALVGDSSGGAIAALAAQRLAAAGMALSALLLVCPNTDMTLSQPSVVDKGRGWGLEADALRWFVDQWLPHAGPGDLAWASPLHADLSALPLTLIATAEHDPLRDEGAALAARLREQRVAAHHVAHPGLVHGFWTLDAISPAAEAAGDALMERLATHLPRGDAGHEGAPAGA